MSGSKSSGTFIQWNTMQQKERTPTLFDSMDWTGEHYAKWNMPYGERQISYDLTFKWNLINKTQTSKQNITRGMETRNRLTVTRGEVGRCNGGKKEWASHATWIEDSWAQKMGGLTVDVVGGGVGESNGGKWWVSWNWTTIKKIWRLWDWGGVEGSYTHFFPRIKLELQLNL